MDNKKTPEPVADSPPADAPEEVVVTLQHSAFGSHSFRAPEAKVAESIAPQISAARTSATRKAKVAEIDAKQAAIMGEIRAIDEKLSAAALVKATDVQKRLEADKAQAQARVDALAKERAKYDEQ
jgi:hypothetical protein